MRQAKGSHRIDGGMARLHDHGTSIAAAETVSKRKPTIRQRVEDYARRCPLGFIDEELRLLDFNAPESSFRKRRTELAEENIILPSEETRRNSKGQDCTVWRHRDHVINPPPIKPREAKPSRFDALRNEIARLKAEVREARLAEASVIVAYLRKIDEFSSRCYADAIERGEHRR